MQNAENQGFFENFSGYDFLRRNRPMSDDGGAAVSAPPKIN